MAKNSTKTANKGAPEVTAELAGRTIYYDQLHFIPTKEKTTYWAAQVLYFNKMSYVPFVEEREVQFFRDLELGKINEKLYKEFIDPKTPDGKGGEAKYFKANWKTCPIYMHLENIKEAQLKKMPFNYVCKASDEFSKLKQQEENDKIIGAKYLREFLNEINPEFGIRQLRPDEDPFTFINQMEKQGQTTAPGQASSPTTPTNAIDGIKAKIFDNDTLAIYNQYLYKSGVEVAFEIGIDTYINAINKFKQGILPKLIEDVKNVNAHIYRHYTSTTTGRPIIEYKDPGKVRTAKFSKPDLSDCTGFMEEFDISFGEFVQMAGGDLKPEVLKEIFNKNRQFHGLMNSPDYDKSNTFQRNSARIRIGYHEFETQNMDVYADYITKQGNNVFKRVDDNYNPSDYSKNTFKAKRVEKHYNVWYSFYYIPIDSLFTISGTTSFADQAKYIFKFGPVQDQMREGDDMRYSKGTWIGYKSNRFSFAKIEHSFMPEIIKLWQLFQNDLSVSMSDGQYYDESIIENMMKYVDSGGSDDSATGKRNKKMEALRFIRQTNSAVVNFTDDTGENTDRRQKTLFQKIENNSLDTAAKRLVMIMDLYKLLTQSLGFNEIAEGQSPEPRQNLGGINLAMAASSNALYQMEEALIASQLNLGERMMYYIKEIVDEGEDSVRFQEFQNIVGRANAMAAQSIKDIPLHKMSLHLEDQMTDQLKAAILQTANEMAKSGIIAPDQVLFLQMIENVKYAYAILAIEIRAGQKAMQDAQAQSHMQTRSDQLFTSGLKIRENHAARADDAYVDKMLGQIEIQKTIIDNQLRTKGQVITKDQINQHRTQQAIIESNLRMRELTAQQGMLSRSAKSA